MGPRIEGAGSTSVRRFGFVVLALAFVESALGVGSADSGGSPLSAVFAAHVTLGIALVAVVWWAYSIARRRAVGWARRATGATAVLLTTTGATGAIFLVTGFRGAGLLDRGLALMTLVSAAVMIAVGRDPGVANT